MTTLTPTTIALSCTLLATLQQVSSHCLQQEQIPSICMHDVAQSLVLACTIAALPCPLDALGDGPTFSTTITYSFPSNRSDGILLFAIRTPELWYF